MGGSAARSADARQAQLRALEAQFYQQFEWPEEKAVHPKQSGDMEEEVDEEEVEDKDEEDEEEEKDEEDEDEDEDEDYTEDDADGDNHPEWDDATDLLQSAQGPALPLKSHGRQPETVVFTDPSASRASAPMSKQARKQFMHIARDAPDAPPAPSDDDSDEDQRANDQKLTELLSTTLFAPGSMHTSKKRKLTTTTNETLARVLELSHADTIQRPAPGSPWAENELKKKELGKMPARIRQGLRRAAGERRDRDIATKKELGLWNPKIDKQTHMSRGSSVARGSKATQPKQRMRGIGSGVGHYRGGVLHLSDRDVQRIRQTKR